MVICSRKKENVDRAVGELRSKGLEVFGMPCHVAKAADRKQLIEEVNYLSLFVSCYINYLFQ